MLSAGCHSGYNIVDGGRRAHVTNPFDWTQRMAQQHAVLIGGTGYQYGDTDFLEYSERLYLDVARRLHEGHRRRRAPVAIGNALVLAKQDYLSGLGTVSGIDQKAMLAGHALRPADDRLRRARPYADRPTAPPRPRRRSPPARRARPSGSRPTTCRSTPRPTRDTKAVVDADPRSGLPATRTWLAGRDGVTVLPGAPALPKQIEDVTVPGQVLRGVGFRAATTPTPRGSCR